MSEKFDPKLHQFNPMGVKTRRAIAGDEWFDLNMNNMSEWDRYWQVFATNTNWAATWSRGIIPQQSLMSIGQGPVTSVIALQMLAFVLSVCSTVDAFLALSFVNTFTAGAVIAFLVFGPMLDIKSVIMYLGVFRPRVVFYLAALTFLAALLVGVFINLNVSLVP